MALQIPMYPSPKMSLTLYYLSFLKNTNIHPPQNKISCPCFVPQDSKSNMAHHSVCFSLQNLLCIGFPRSSLASSLSCLARERPFKASSVSSKDGLPESSILTQSPIFIWALIHWGSHQCYKGRHVPSPGPVVSGYIGLLCLACSASQKSSLKCLWILSGVENYEYSLSL